MSCDPFEKGSYTRHHPPAQEKNEISFMGAMYGGVRPLAWNNRSQRKG